MYVLQLFTKASKKIGEHGRTSYMHDSRAISCFVADEVTLFSTSELGPSQIAVSRSQKYQTGSVPLCRGKSSALEQFTQPVINFKDEDSVWNKTLHDHVLY
jgi:hypothetical protein